MTFRMPDSYYDPPEPPDEIEVRREERRAKAVHLCTMCRKPINIGDKYVRYIFKSPDYPGKIRIEKTHMHDCVYDVPPEGDF